MSEINPSHIMQVGLGFWGSKTLLSAVELGLFSILGEEGLPARRIAALLGLHRRAIPDFPDALVALNFLEREGNGEKARYKNTPETEMFLNRESPAYIGGMLEMANKRLYGFWGNLTEALRTGKPQNETKDGESLFDTLYADPELLEQFMNAMSGISMGNFMALANRFDFTAYKTLCDVGGATGQLCTIIAAQHEHLTCTSFDLAPVEPIAKRHIEAAGMSERVKTQVGDFFEDDLPKADVITMSMILHDWNLEQKQRLIKSAYDALPAGGAFVVIEAIIDDERRENAFGLLMSLNMLIEIGDAFDYTFADFKGWCEEAGFRRFERFVLAGPASAVVAFK